MCGDKRSFRPVEACKPKTAEELFESGGDKILAKVIEFRKKIKENPKP